ncbi:uncharacterized protein B0I36DRAFT_377652 [Microdochium trichocladiopsis]|uniref:ER-bound oxygenase mpaB/mpaB'/Rubber oxygenase catalytic domain-containing protein n=1 Tax=Microdochium trichocladiopsis TaxID=1682393 RepID=A0A9P9BJV3_9PEZI|nr:uncharacterized protein B0I36DRAFT_377652 [Microdochium trichocladiopsis]KAH7018465.1 hypothetical protein B0I36DRAFT_377652 [Microdochium trichocladiopsis]
MNITSQTIGDAATATARPLVDLVGKLAATLPAPLQELLASTSWKQVVVPSVLAYMGLVRALRYRREHALRRELGYFDRASLSAMTADEAQKIIFTMGFWEFPFLHYTSLQFGLFKTYGIETIAKLLLGTRNLTDPIKSRKRYEDTALLISEFLTNPPSSERAMSGIARMNFLHSRYVKDGQISNTDLLYTLSVFVLEPPRFARLYDWRAMNEMEVCAYGVLWKAIGDDMGIEYKGHLPRAEQGWKDGLEFVEDIEAWAHAYEIDKMKPSKVAAAPARALIPMLLYWLPWFMHPFATECVCVLMNTRVREAFLLPEPGITAGMVVYTSLWLRRFFLRYFSLPRTSAFLRLEDPDPKTGRMFLTDAHGNYPFYIKPTFWNRWGPKALLVKAYGGFVPGDDPKQYFSQGYKFEEIGPLGQIGKGVEEMNADVKRMAATGRSGCPFI